MSGIRLETVILQPFRDFRDFEGFHPHLVPAPNPEQWGVETGEFIHSDDRESNAPILHRFLQSFW